MEGGDIMSAHISTKQLTNLTNATSGINGTYTGDYALFGGGLYNSTYYNTIDVYDKSLTKVASSIKLTAGVSDPGAAHVGNYALFVGGYTGQTGTNATSNQVNAFNKSLTKSTYTLSSKTQITQSVSVGDYALFFYSNSFANSFNTSLTRGIPTVLSYERFEAGVTNVNNVYALIFAGQTVYQRVPHYNVDTYNTSLTKNMIDLQNVIQEATDWGATRVGNHALFTTYSSSKYSNQTVSIDTSLTVNEINNALNYNVLRCKGSDINNEIGVFAGGVINGSNYPTNKCCGFDTSITRVFDVNLPCYRQRNAIAPVGNSIIFAGGMGGTSSGTNSSTNTVDSLTMVTGAVARLVSKIYVGVD